MKRITIDVGENDWEALVLEAEKLEVSATLLIRTLIKQFLADKSEKTLVLSTKETGGKL